MRTNLVHCPACGRRTIVVLTRRLQRTRGGATLYEFPHGECLAGHDIAWAARFWKAGDAADRRSN